VRLMDFKVPDHLPHLQGRSYGASRWVPGIWEPLDTAGVFPKGSCIRPHTRLGKRLCLATSLRFLRKPS
jgi:hypothetical protein